MRQKNARLRDKIDELLNHHPELRDVVDGIAVHQGTHVQKGVPFLDRIHANPQERARAIIELRPEFEHHFDD